MGDAAVLPLLPDPWPAWPLPNRSRCTRDAPPGAAPNRNAGSDGPALDPGETASLVPCAVLEGLQYEMATASAMKSWQTEREYALYSAKGQQSMW